MKDKQNNDKQFLKAGDQHPLSAPESYFDSLPNQIMGKIEKEEWRSLAPTLSTIKKTEPFLAPRSYFEIAPEMITAVVLSSNQTNKQKKTIVRRLVYTVSSIAAVLIVALMLRSPEQQNTSLSFEDITLEEYDSYMDENINWLYNDDELGELLAFESKSINTEEHELEDFILNEVPLDELINEF